MPSPTMMCLDVARISSMSSRSSLPGQTMHMVLLPSSLASAHSTHCSTVLRICSWKSSSSLSSSLVYSSRSSGVSVTG